MDVTCRDRKLKSGNEMIDRGLVWGRKKRLKVNTNALWSRSKCWPPLILLLISSPSSLFFPHSLYPPLPLTQLCCLCSKSFNAFKFICRHSPLLPNFPASSWSLPSFAHPWIPSVFSFYSLRPSEEWSTPKLSPPCYLKPLSLSLSLIVPVSLSLCVRDCVHSVAQLSPNSP